MKRRKPEVFFTSDTFFGRTKSALERGYEDTEQMVDDMIEKWNSSVKEDDVVYHLGNFAWDPISAETAINLLNGKIFFLSGEYDSFMSSISLIKVGVHTIFTNQIGSMKDQRFIVTHWPLLNWPGKDDGYLQFHAGDLKSDFENNRINVNCSNWGNKPVSLDVILDISKIATNGK